jgi:four helix bundle protein
MNNNSNPIPKMYNRCEDLIIELNKTLHHFPAFEKYGIQCQIRNTAYDVLAGIIECEKKYHNKTSLSKLDIRHEQLRCLINMSYKLKYFHYKNGKMVNTDSVANRRYMYISLIVDEIGKYIGSWIKNYYASNNGVMH